MGMKYVSGMGEAYTGSAETGSLVLGLWGAVGRINMDDLKGAFEELISTMRRSGFAYPETLREGLSEAEVLDQTSELPFALPDEVV